MQYRNSSTLKLYMMIIVNFPIDSFTKLEGMFKDIDLSKELTTQFHNSTEHRNNCFSQIDMSVQVLTTGYWPAYSPCDLNLPLIMKECQVDKVYTILMIFFSSSYMLVIILVKDGFFDFYKDKYSGRRLTWQHSLGTGIVKAHFPSGVKELCVSLFQAIILLLFNVNESLTLRQIKDLSSIGKI
jgi:cullin-4